MTRQPAVGGSVRCARLKFVSTFGVVVLAVVRGSQLPISSLSLELTASLLFRDFLRTSGLVRLCSLTAVRKYDLMRGI